MILSFEGPPAAGKSTLSEACASLERVNIVPEVNLLFKRPEQEPTNWYLERQVCRWEIAAKMAEKGNLAILDGDPFQPLWFGWIYRDEGWTSVSECDAFYKRMIRDGRIRFPELYLFLTLPEGVRQEREISRSKKRGHNLEKCLKKYKRYVSLVGPQRNYFEALKREFPERVQIYDSESTIDARSLIESTERSIHNPNTTEDLKILDFMTEWLKTNEGESIACHNSGKPAS